jgi:hypothetical protein
MEDRIVIMDKKTLSTKVVKMEDWAREQIGYRLISREAMHKTRHLFLEVNTEDQFIYFPVKRGNDPYYKGPIETIESSEERVTYNEIMNPNSRINNERIFHSIIVTSDCFQRVGRKSIDEFTDKIKQELNIQN